MRAFIPASMLLTPLLVAVPTPAPAGQTGAAAVTFTKDIAPLLQRSCQNCHRPGSVPGCRVGTRICAM